MVGIGPGDWRELTLRAAEALEAAEVIVGYTLYVDLVRPHLPGKDFRATGMQGEAERCLELLDGLRADVAPGSAGSDKLEAARDALKRILQAER